MKAKQSSGKEKTRRERKREGEKQRTEEEEEVVEEKENALVMQRQGSIGKHQAENFYRTLLRLWRVGGN